MINYMKSPKRTLRKDMVYLLEMKFAYEDKIYRIVVDCRDGSIVRMESEAIEGEEPIQNRPDKRENHVEI